MEYILRVIQCQYLLRLQSSKAVIKVKLVIVRLIVYTTMELKITELQQRGLIKGRKEGRCVFLCSSC